jgi:S-adenosylmethionine-diacylglycerol 3-amino-3-carboxypropyl transferase
MSTIARAPPQFVVVREDPRVEREVVRALRPRRVLLVASGSCTALALRAWFPRLEIALIEPNPAQVAHVERKLAALARGAAPAEFNVGEDASEGLHECGRFERLFRLFRTVLDLFVVPPVERALRLEQDAAWDDVVGHPWWPVAFELAFADPLLRTMFGPARCSTQSPAAIPPTSARGSRPASPPPIARRTRGSTTCCSAATSRTARHGRRSSANRRATIARSP